MHTHPYIESRATFLQKRGFKPLEKLAEEKPHGTRVRYMTGCRCFGCRSANTAYEAARKIARLRGEDNGLVSAERARQHLEALSARGVGRRIVSEVSDVPATTLALIRSGARRNVRKETERRILSVTPAQAGDATLICAKPTWKLLNALLRDGYSKAALALHLGYRTRALQINNKRVTVKTASRVRLAYEALRYVPSRRARTLVRWLTEEGFSRGYLVKRLGEMAQQAGFAVDTLDLGRRVPKRIEALLEKLHAELTA